MIFAISLLAYLIIFAIGLYIVYQKPTLVDKDIEKVAFVGFIVQILINLTLWRQPKAFVPFMPLQSMEKSAVNFMGLCLISVFCYASLLVLFYKTHDYQNPEIAGK
nr:hypothetical protein [uncultured Moraxella sp.]